MTDSRQNAAYSAGFVEMKRLLPALPDGERVLGGLLVVEDVLLDMADRLPGGMGAAHHMAGLIAGAVNSVSDSPLEAFAAQRLILDSLSGVADTYPDSPPALVQVVRSLVIFADTVTEEAARHNIAIQLPAVMN